MIVRSIKDCIIDSFVFSGRSERLEHWAFLLFTALSVAILQVLGVLGVIMVFPFNWAVVCYLLWLCIANVAVAVRRLHDHGISGLWLLLNLIPMFMMFLSAKSLYGSGVAIMNQENALLLFKISQGGMVSVFVVFGSLFMRPGSKKSNQYGDSLI